MILLFARGINLFKIVAGYLISLITGRVIHWGNPLAVSIEPNNSCNLRCPECPAGMKDLTRPRGFMQTELFQTIVDQLLPHLSWLTLYFQGEPYLSKHFFDFIVFARSKKIFVATSTNGHFLDESSVHQTIESGLNRLIISLDGADQQSYETYRNGGDFNKVVAGIRLLVSEKNRLKKRNPEIILQSLLLRSNEYQLDKIRKLAKELGVDKLEFKTAQFYDYKNGNSLMPGNLQYSRYAIKNHLTINHLTLNTGLSTNLLPRQYFIKHKLRNSCFRMWSSTVITWDGKVVPCCFDKDAKYMMGDLNNQTFGEIWRSKPYNDFRKNILQRRKFIDICSNCSQTF